MGRRANQSDIADLLRTRLVLGAASLAMFTRVGGGCRPGSSLNEHTVEATLHMLVGASPAAE